MKSLATRTSAARFIEEKARELGFQAVGFTDARSFEATEEVVLQRIDAGLMAGLSWFTPARAQLSCRPQKLLPRARTIVALAASYYTPGDSQARALFEHPKGRSALHRGRVARYAWGRDYHDVLKARCRALVEALAGQLGYRPGARIFVDSSPLADRAVAQRAGVGWFGKNTNILVHGLGSWAFLAAIILDIDLPEDEPLLTNCGSCDLCIRACPTGALIDQYTLDNQRCISYQTIENRGSIPQELRPLIGDWVFGCDVCQDVCPVNRRAGTTAIPEFEMHDPEAARPSLGGLLLMETEEYQQRSRGRALKRAKQPGLQRNTAVALGNTGDRGVVEVLEKGLSNPDGLVRSHVAWAMGQLGGKRARGSLEQARRSEEDRVVGREIQSALERA